MPGCRRLSPAKAADECMVAVQLLRAMTARDRRLCRMLPATFPDQRMMCDAYVDYYEVRESRASGYRYLDQGAIEQAMQGNILLLGVEEGGFREAANAYGVDDGVWSWNAKFADLDNDEWQDIYITNGWWLENSIYSNKFFHNDRGQRFRAEEKEFGLSSNLKESSYTYIDIDNDGDIDLVTRAMHGQINVFINNERHNNLITFSLNDERGNRFGIGTKLYIYYGKNQERHQVREIKAGSGYLSFDAPYAHFGLGSHTGINKLAIHWSTGEKTVIEKTFPANTKYILTRPSGAATVLSSNLDRNSKIPLP
jgi:hypothetical protein